MPPTTRRRHLRDRDRRVFTPRRVRRIEGATLLVLATVGVILATLRPSADGASALCLVCGPYAGIDAVVNMLLFIPIGAGMALLGLRWRSAMLIGIAATVVIETLQLALPLGRVASVFDLVTTAIGTALGYYLAEHRRTLVYPRSRSALRYAITICGAWLLLLTLTAAALLPSVPGGGYVAQWAPAVDGLDRYAGRVFASHVSGVPLPNGIVAEAERLRAGMKAGMAVEATIAPVGTPRRLAPVVRLMTTDSAEVVLLAQRGDDLLFRSRVLGSALRLGTPAVVMPEALSSRFVSASQTIVVSGARARGQLRAAAFGSESVLDLHAGAGWLLLTPSGSTVQSSADLASAVWVGMPLFAAGYWTGRRARRRARRAGDATRMRGASGQILMAVPVLMGITIVGLSGISALFGLTQPPLPVWLGAATAIGIGLAVGASFAMSHDARPHGTAHSGATAGGTPPPEARVAKA